MRSRRLLLVLTVGAIFLAAAQEGPTGEGPLATLSKGVPAGELLPRTSDAEAAAARAAELLDAKEGGPSACKARCGEAAQTLDRVCEALIQPTAARSKALCHVRASEEVARCERRCSGE